MAPAVDMKLTEQTLARYAAEPRHLISVLQDVQLAYRYLPEEPLKLVAKVLGVPLAKVYGVATFYKAFSLVPRGKTVLRVCTGTACHIRGAPLIVGELERRLGIVPGQTTEDMEFSDTFYNLENRLRRSLQFKALTGNRLSELEYFIRHINMTEN